MLISVIKQVHNTTRLQVMLRYAMDEPACVWEAGLRKIRRHSLESHFLMRNNFENVNVYKILY